MNLPFADHFSAVAAEYAGARPDYPDALFDWIATHAPARGLAWEAGCGSGQASRGLARHFASVWATDPAAAQIAQARAPGNVTFAVEPAEHCSLDNASVDAVCVAQALHWFDRTTFFGECARVLKPAGVLVAWGYQDIVVPPELQAANDALQRAIAPHWPAQRALIDSGYSGFDWPFARMEVPSLTLQVQWSLPRLLGYFASYSASQRYRDATGADPVAQHEAAFAAAWGDPDATRTLHWPLFIHARRRSTAQDDACSPA
jgi:SAM-dependent methyltransferase